MLNKAMIIGRLGRDPELRYTQSGVPVTTLNVATSETYIDRDGNKNEITEWHRVSVFQRQAENCVKFLRKGSLVFVEGSLQTRKWQDQQGVERTTTVIKAQRVTFLDKRSDYAPRDEYEGGYHSRAGYDRAPNHAPGQNAYGTSPYGQDDYGHPFGGGSQEAELGSYQAPAEGSPFPSEMQVSEQSAPSSEDGKF
ncbi:MAG: single-stranded DNA-binding protein [Desulfovibrio sp.]|nr:single-stranded DNA-binding protein [Desulfovibrio sp.]